MMALSLCFAAIELNEGPYWATAMYVAGSDPMGLNTGGNVGGLIWYSCGCEWTAAFPIELPLALFTATAWLGIDATRRRLTCS
jgi:hypothetical protein